MKNFELCIAPVETYKAPEIPMFMNDNSALLKKLPSRWQKNVKVIACMGVIGSFTLTGCMNNSAGNGGYAAEEYNIRNEQINYSGYSEDELVIRLHGGGNGSSFYIVHLTEQEAFGIIRARLETAGLDFRAALPLPNLRVGEFGIDLFDEQKNVAITNINWEDSHRRFSPWGRYFAMMVERALAEQGADVIVGAFYNSGKFINSEYRRADNNERVRNETPIVSEIEEESRLFLREKLNAQADAFVAFLQSEGILESQKEINIVINGVQAEFDSSPVILNNQVMVPSPEIFEVLGMEVRGRGLSAVKGDLTIGFDTSVGRSSLFGDGYMRLNNDRVRIGTPAIVYGDKVLLPLQYIMEAVGASMEWDEDMTTIRINTN